MLLANKVILVLIAPIFICLFLFFFAAAPTFSESPVDITASVGDNITLPCIARGFPTPSLTWRRQDGRPIFGKSSGHVGTSQLPSGALQIQSEFLYLSLSRCLGRMSLVCCWLTWLLKAF
uniref:Ig-like domain-containing protein n=1 Tax=Cyprinus carpio TaxID=7962 RepID=A0A8C1NCW2_CYPCA